MSALQMEAVEYFYGNATDRYTQCLTVGFGNATEMVLQLYNTIFFGALRSPNSVINSNFSRSSYLPSLRKTSLRSWLECWTR